MSPSYAGVNLAQFGRQPVMLQQIVARLDAEARRVQRRSQRERPAAADRVQPAEKAADPLEYVGIVEQRRAPAASRKDREAEPFERM